MKKMLLLCVAGWLMYSCGSVPVTGRQQLLLVGDQEVLTLSLQQYDEFMKTAKKSTHKEQTALVEKVGKKIAEAVSLYFQVTGLEDQLSAFNWEFNLVQDDQVNAFCMPGGKIVVYEGILPYTQNETGLAVVLGHEVAHAVAKHSNERLSQQIVTEMGTQAASQLLLGKQSETTQAVGQVAMTLGVQYLYTLPFGRKQELEADELGLVFMAIAGYDPNAAIPFWQRMAQQGSAVPEWMSTHPSHGNRIDRIEAAIPVAMEYYNAIYGTAPAAQPEKKAPTSEEWRF